VTFRHIYCVTILATLLALPASRFLGRPRFQENPAELLKEADRLAWLRNWSRAEPLFTRAEELFRARTDDRNALYAMVGKLRGQLPRLPIQQTSNQLADLLEYRIVKSDAQLRLRILTVKGDTDMDLDIDLAQRDWSAALDAARMLGDKAWEARATGELGIIDFMQGNAAGALLKVSTAIRSAQELGDIASQVRYVTLSASAMTESGNAGIALNMLDTALATAEQNPDVGTAVMTYARKAEALAKLNRTAEAEDLLQRALVKAREAGSLGYQAELLAEMGAMANRAGNFHLAIARLKDAIDLAERANGHAQVASNCAELVKIYLGIRDLDAAHEMAQKALNAVRQAGDKFHLPTNLSQLAEVKTALGRHAEAAALYEEAVDLVNAQLMHASSPSNKASRIGTMDAVYVGYLRLAASKLNDLNRAFTIVEQARGRSLADLIVSRDVIPNVQPPEMTEFDRRISALQIQLLSPHSRDERKQILDKLLETELFLAPVAAANSRPWMQAQIQPISLRDFQATLRTDEVVLEYVLDDPTSFCIVITRDAARLQSLAAGTAITRQAEAVLSAIRARTGFENSAKTLYESILAPIRETRAKTNLIVVPDGVLHRLPLEVLVDSTGKELLQTHVLSYVPSSNVLALLRRPRTPIPNGLPVLAVSASTEEAQSQISLGRVQRGIFDLEDIQLPPLPGANDEVKSVARTFGDRSRILLGAEAKETNIKTQPLERFRILHFAVHGLLSTTYPERSALVLQTDAASGEDGLLQAREISQLRLNADLVTLSACDAGSGKIRGQEGVAALVRPFFVAGAQSVVANLWQADDQFTLSLMREFYRRLANGDTKAVALRDAKLELIKRFGADVPPILWAGFIIVGEPSNSVIRPGGARQ